MSLSYTFIGHLHMLYNVSPTLKLNFEEINIIFDLRLLSSLFFKPRLPRSRTLDRPFELV